jgi:hypothetical protein
MIQLRDLLQALVSKINKYRPLYEKNEANVRTQLVEPVLRAIGWEVENPEDVLANPSTEEGIPDYALLINGKPVLMVEAKKLGEDVKTHIRQLAKYCFNEGTEYGLLTNGVTWLLFRSFQAGTSVSERVIWTTDIEDEEMDAVVRKVRTVSKNDIERVDVLVKKMQILEEVFDALADEPRDMAKRLLGRAREIIADAYPDYEFDDAEIEDFLYERLTNVLFGSHRDVSLDTEHESPPSQMERPRKMHLKDKTYELRFDYEILVNVANWLIDIGRLTAAKCPVPSGYKRYLIAQQPKHKDGSAFRAPKQLAKGLCIETHWSTAQCITLAKRLLERLGLPANTLKLES